MPGPAQLARQFARWKTILGRADRGPSSHRNGQGSHPPRPRRQPDRRRRGDRAAVGRGEGAARERPRRGRHPRLVEFAHGGPLPDPGGGQRARDVAARTHGLAPSPCHEQDRRRRDLDRLATFGFRGEALPSIASVSRFTLQTREPESDSGTEIVVHAGRIAARAGLREAGRHTHRRRASVRAGPGPQEIPQERPDRGGSHRQLRPALRPGLPGSLFTLSRTAGRFSGPRNARPSPERVSEIYGAQAAEGLLPLDVSEAGLRLSGLIGRPGVGRATRHDMVTFVNSRPVDSRALNGALIESYREIAAPGELSRSPLFSSSAGRPRST